MNNTVLSDTISNDDMGETIDSDVDKAAVTSNVDVQLLTLKHCGQSDLEEALGHTGTTMVAVAVALEDLVVVIVVAVTWLVVGVAVESVALTDDVVEQERLEVLLTV